MTPLECPKPLRGRPPMSRAKLVEVLSRIYEVNVEGRSLREASRRLRGVVTHSTVDRVAKARSAGQYPPELLEEAKGAAILRALHLLEREGIVERCGDRWRAGPRVGEKFSGATS